MSSDPTEVQRSFYAEGEHAHLRPRVRDPYATKLSGRLVARLGIGPGDRVVELGAGFGRFTFHLLEHCRSVEAVDLSARSLESLERTRRERGIPEERCRVHCADADSLPPALSDRPADFVVGFFFLHHVPDFARTIARAARLLAPGGGMAFVEPNRRNPSFLVQVAVCRDMDWRSERGLFRLSGRAVERAYRDAGLTRVETGTFGLFPPQILNRSALARRAEAAVEGVAPLRPLLPFLLLSARAGAA